MPMHDDADSPEATVVSNYSPKHSLSFVERFGL
jgi:hypothetical protein